MFTNPGKILKGFAIAFAYIGIGIGVVLLLVSIIVGASKGGLEGTVYILCGLIIALLLFVSSYISGLMLAAYGEIVETQGQQAACQQEIAEALNRMSTKTNSAHSASTSHSLF